MTNPLFDWPILLEVTEEIKSKLASGEPPLPPIKPPSLFLIETRESSSSSSTHSFDQYLPRIQAHTQQPQNTPRN